MEMVELMPYLLLGTLAFVGLIFLALWWKNKKLPVTQEPSLGQYRIDVDTGERIHSFEGELRLARGLSSDSFFMAIGKFLATSNPGIEELEAWRGQPKYSYAMRQGNDKIVFLSLPNGIESEPYSKPIIAKTLSLAQSKRTVQAIGQIISSKFKTTLGTFNKVVVLQPYDLTEHAPKIVDLNKLENIANLFRTIAEKAPHFQQLALAQDTIRTSEAKIRELKIAVEQEKATNDILRVALQQQTLEPKTPEEIALAQRQQLVKLFKGAKHFFATIGVPIVVYLLIQNGIIKAEPFWAIISGIAAFIIGHLVWKK